MTIDALKRIAVFLMLCLGQVLVLNRIQLFGYATPLLYVYFILIFPRNYPKWELLLWSFCLGLVIDAFTNTPGVASTSLTFIGALQPYLLELFVPRDADEDMQPSIKSMGWQKFLTYSVLITLAFCLVFFTIEAFNLLNWLHWLKCVTGSTIITLLLIFTLETVRK
jgi:rod shape-determining protein MreD